ncbi:MAG: hypothetical protein LLG20_01895 [Acidobacteriales bacterium]|nr:hypothetical protein [Terriglobales bacterium]
METKGIAELLIQGGFAGMCAVLLGLLFWMIKTLIALIREHNTVLQAHTIVMSEIDKRSGELLQLNRQVHDRLLARPCLMKKTDDV